MRCSFTELRHVCSNNDECDDGMLCAVDRNNTKSTHGNQNQNQPQVCLCNGDDGYKEDVEDNSCNGKSCTLYQICYYVIFFRFWCLHQTN